MTGFQVGDRVAGVPASVFNSGNGNQYGTFQEYAVVQTDRAFKIPDSWSFSDASVFPLAISTAAPSLFAKDRLALELPQVQIPASNGKVLLVWGGSSSVGASAIQLAVHAGYEVFATASKRNFNLVKSFGASKLFDYTDKNVIEDIANAIRGRERDYVGAFSAADGNGLPPAAFVAEKLGLKGSIVATTNPRVPQEGIPDGVKVLPSALLISYFPCMAAAKADLHLSPDIATQCFEEVGPGLPALLDIGEAVFRKWLPEAMAAGTLKVSPPAKVVGQGPQVVQEAVDFLRKGSVSGQKLVITL